MTTRLRLLIAVGILALLALAAPAAGAAPPTQPTLFIFEIYHQGVLVGRTVTEETFHGNSGVSTGTWTTYSPTNAVLATGRLTARHSETGLVASVTQLSPVHGHGTLTTQFLTQTTGAGSLAYVVEGGASGTVAFTTKLVSPNIPNFFEVHLQGPVPPVLFTRGD